MNGAVNNGFRVQSSVVMYHCWLEYVFGMDFLTRLAVSLTIPCRLFGSSLNWCFRNSCLRPLGTSVEWGTQSSSSRNRAGHLINASNWDNFHLMISTEKKPLCCLPCTTVDVSTPNHRMGFSAGAVEWSRSQQQLELCTQNKFLPWIWNFWRV